MAKKLILIELDDGKEVRRNEIPKDCEVIFMPKEIYLYFTGAFDFMKSALNSARIPSRMD